MYEFTWAVPEKGFTWTTEAKSYEDWRGISQVGFPHKAPYLVVHEQDAIEGRAYHPLEETPTLFEEFANTEPTPEGVLCFANRYGLLTHGTSLGIPDAENRINFDLKGEGLNFWREEIAAVKEVYTLWNYLRQKNLPQLNAHIYWERDAVFFSRNPLPDGDIGDIKKMREAGKLKRIADANGDCSDPTVFRSFVWGDVIAPAKVYIQRTISFKFGFIPQPYRAQVRPWILRDGTWNLHPYIMPRNLLSALWLQVYLAVTGQKRFIQCEICGQLLEVTDANRKTKRFHDTCRKREWARRQRVVGLWKEGKTVEEIITETGFEPEKVAAWIKKKRGV